MDIQQKITVKMWHELSDEKKEVIRKWAVSQNLGLDIIPSTTAETCDYAALLTIDQLKQFLADRGINKEYVPHTINEIWNQLCNSR